MRRYRVRISRAAKKDLLRLLGFLMDRDPSLAGSARAVLATAFQTLERLPFASRMAVGSHGDPTLRELVVPFGKAGYVPLFRVTDARTVSVLAARSQREGDYH